MIYLKELKARVSTTTLYQQVAFFFFFACFSVFILSKIGIVLLYGLM